MGAVISSVARPVQGGSTDFGGGLFGGLLGKVFQQAMDQQPTQPTGITSIPVTNQNPTVNMTGGRFNQVRDPRLNRVASRPMFRTPQRRPTTDPMGRSYSDPRYYKMGGRVNYQDGGSSKNPPKFIPMDLESVAFRLFKDNLDNLTYNQKQTIYDYIEQNRNKKAKGGIINLRSKYSDGGKIRSYEEKYLINKGYQDMLKNMSEKEIKQLYDSVMGTFTQSKAMGGIMNLKMGGMPVEMDLRAKGGFVPIGKKERADDVPARLSKNEFVFTANAVRNAGNGDIRKGAKRMYDLMHQLEAKR